MRPFTCERALPAISSQCDATSRSRNSSMSLIQEADQKLVNDYLAMIAEDSKPLMALGFNSPQGLTAYRAMMAKIVPYTNPPGYKSKPVASFNPAVPLRPGLTAAIAIPHGQGPFPIMIHAHGRRPCNRRSYALNRGGPECPH